MQDKIKVLIVDDSLVFRKAVETVLLGEDEIVIAGSAWNGAKALEAIRKSRPDIVTLDIEMPELDGLETLKAIQEINNSSSEPPIGVIMLSAFTKSGADITVKALQMGAFDFITKPETSSVEESVEVLKAQLPLRIKATPLPLRKWGLLELSRTCTAYTHLSSIATL
jgi:two-component system chemotaxis response regulator CheB